MDRIHKKPIIISGTHRSGSTWLGKMLALSPGVRYVHEPFMPIHAKPIMGLDINWFHYLTKEELRLYYGNLSNGLGLTYVLSDVIRQIKNADTLRKKGAFIYRFAYFNIFGKHKRPIIKDPIAFFSLSQLSEIFDLDVVCLVRHPAAFVASLKRVDWTIEFEDWFGQQKELVGKYFEPDWQEILDAKESNDIIWQGSVFWRIVHKTMLVYKENYPEWHIIRHEDVSKNPVEELEGVYNKLNLEFSPTVKEKIIEATGNHNKAMANGETVLDLNRDSRKLVDNWKHTLTSDEISRIRKLVSQVSGEFYSNDEW